ncbi:MAG: hypothetical protein ACLQJR_00070 [Stellaceae bacterium]
MPTPPEDRKGEKDPPSQPHGDLRQACLAIVQDLAEPLTALGNYLEAASRLHEADTRSAQIKLGEVIDRSRAQASRAADILRRLRDLLR